MSEDCGHKPRVLAMHILRIILQETGDNNVDDDERDEEKQDIVATLLDEYDQKISVLNESNLLGLFSFFNKPQLT